MLNEAHLAIAAAMALSLSQPRQYFHPLPGVAPHFHAHIAPTAPAPTAEQLATRVCTRSKRQTNVDGERGLYQLYISSESERQTSTD